MLNTIRISLKLYWSHTLGLMSASVWCYSHTRADVCLCLKLQPHWGRFLPLSDVTAILGQISTCLTLQPHRSRCLPLSDATATLGQKSASGWSYSHTGADVCLCLTLQPHWGRYLPVWSYSHTGADICHPSLTTQQHICQLYAIACLYYPGMNTGY